MTLSTAIQNYIVEQYLSGAADGLDEDTPLLDLNIVDSSSIFDLVRFISNQTGVKIPISGINAKNFSSIGAMVRMVDALRAAGGT